MLIFGTIPLTRPMRTLTALTLATLLLSACGLKGPLYLPQEPAPEKPPASQDAEKKK